MERMSAWRLVSLPPGRSTIGCRWVFKIKSIVDGHIQKYKARLVAKGFTQIPGIDFTETFSPTVKLQSLRIIFALAAYFNLELHQLDVVAAFLYGFLNEEIFMALPEGLEVSDPTQVCLLQRSIYGLKQAARMWYERFHFALLNIGFISTSADNNVYILRRDSQVLILALYVDDTILASSSPALLVSVKTLLSQEFRMTDLGEAYHVLGMHIQRNRDAGWLRLNQSHYITQKLQQFNLATCKPSTTPFAFGCHLSHAQFPTTPVETQSMSNIPYQSATGSLMWAMICSRPDIAFSVSTVSQFMSNPGPEHWTAVKRIFRYLRGTTSYFLQYQRSSSPFHLQGFSDASYADNVYTRKSTSGFCFQLAGGTISWSSRKQKTVALSSTESKYMALANASSEAIWLRRLLSDLGYRQKTTELFCNNRSAIALISTTKYHDRSKHIDVKYHYIKDQVSSGDISIHHISTQEMTADLFTKGLNKGLHQKHTTALGLSSIEELSN